MKLLVIQDGFGKDAGVFIPMKEWELIKKSYPDLENAEKDLQQWEMDLIDERLEAISKNPERLQPGDGLFNELRRKI